MHHERLIMKDKWKNLTESQSKILSVTEKLSKAEGVFLGWYYAALMTGNKDAAQIAFDLKRDISMASSQAIELFDIAAGNE